MKKNMLIALMGVMLTATAAQAEHKLLVTDVLNPGQIEAQARFEYAHGKLDLRRDDERGRLTTNAIESNYSLGVGVLPRLELTASVPYVIREREKGEEVGFEPEYGERDGLGDFAIQAKYLVCGGEKERFAVVTGLGVKFDTARDGEGHVGTGTTDYSPFIAASTNLGHHYIPYAQYRATIRDHQKQDSHTLSLGLEKEINHTFTIDARFDANFNTASEQFTANEDFGVELESYIQLAHNFYVIPSVGYTASSTAIDKEDAISLRSGEGVRAGLSLYYLF